MAEDEVVAVGVASPSPLDHKRKFEDLEPEVLESSQTSLLATTDLNVEPDIVEDAVVLSSDESELKRPRLDDKSEAAVNGNGHGEEEDERQPTLKDTQHVSEEIQTAIIAQPSVHDEHPSVNEEKPNVNELVMENDEQPAGNDEQPATNDAQPAVENSMAGDNDTQHLSVENFTDTQHLSVENFVVEKLNEPSKEENQHPVMEGEDGTDVFSVDEAPTSDIPSQSMTRKVEVPNNKVGVLIGKAGDTIRYLQYNSGAKIQIMRDAETDAYSTSRSVEIVGSLENIKKAEKLINAVIAEADAGGSPSLVARGLAPSQVTSAAEQIQLQVPNEKVGLIIGRGGETIKSLQTRSGARIQLIPQVLPEGEECKERTVRITGDKMQIDIATEMLKEVMSQTVRPSHFSRGSNQQAYHPRGSSGLTQWGSRGPYRSQPTSYDYPQRGPYPPSNPQYPHPAYRNYPPQMGSRSNYGHGWEPRPQPAMQGPPSHGAYDYYGGRGHISDGPVHSQHTNPVHAPGPGPGMGAPHVQPNYNYVEQQGPDYGHNAQYSQPVAHQGYGHGYNGGHGSSQPAYPQAASHTSYAGQQQYDKQASYGLPSQGQPQPYRAPRATQPGEMPYQAASAGQSYGANPQPQPTYPYPSSVSSQQMYPPYGTTAAPDGYSQAPPVSSGSYPQQGAQAGYGQAVAQQAPVYSQAGATGGYGQYPSQQAYPEQQTPNPASYGYQTPQEAAYSGVAATAAHVAVPSGQSGYSQQTAAQPSYDQSTPSSGGNGNVPASAQTGYGKTVSPQPAGYAQYDSTQVYSAPR